MTCLPLNVKHSNIDIFADDATLHSSSPDIRVIQDTLSTDLAEMNQWCLVNKMKINEKKTKCMLVGSNQKLSKLHTRELDLSINNF